MLNQLLLKVEAYTSGSIGRHEFSTWFYNFARAVERQRTDGPLLELVEDIEGTLAESSSGNWSEKDLIEELQSIVTLQSASPSIRS